MAKLTDAVSRMIDAVGTLSPAETEELATHCLQLLDNETMLGVIEFVTSDIDKRELVASWEEATDD